MVKTLEYDKKEKCAITAKCLPEVTYWPFNNFVSVQVKSILF